MSTNDITNTLKLTPQYKKEGDGTKQKNLNEDITQKYFLTVELAQKAIKETKQQPAEGNKFIPLKTSSANGTSIQVMETKEAKKAPRYLGHSPFA